MPRILFSKLAFIALSTALSFFLIAGCDSQNNAQPFSSDKIMEKQENIVTEEEAKEVHRQADEKSTDVEESQADDSIVAVVNGVPIKRSILESQVMLAGAEDWSIQPDEDQDPEETKRRDLEIRAEFLRVLIDFELACQDALKSGYAPSDAEVEEAMAAYKKEDDGPEGLGKTLDRYGETEDSFKEQLIKTLALKKWQDMAFISKMKVSDKEAKEFYEQNIDRMKHGDLIRVSQVFIGVPLVGADQAKEKAHQKAKLALAELKAGADFIAVVSKYSNEPDAKNSGGDMGWLPVEQPHPFINKDVFKMKVGAISDIVESPSGYHIFKVTEEKSAGTEPFDEVKGAIVEFLSNDKLMAAASARIEELRKQADIKILDQDLAKALNHFNGLGAVDKETEKKSGDGEKISTSPKE